MLLQHRKKNKISLSLENSLLEIEVVKQQTTRSGNFKTYVSLKIFALTQKQSVDALVQSTLIFVALN